MTLKETLDLLKWAHCTLCVSSPFDKELVLYKPTKNEDELGMTYLRILSPKVLASEVDIVRATSYNYVNIFLKGWAGGEKRNGR